MKEVAGRTAMWINGFGLHCCV